MPQAPVRRAGSAPKGMIVLVHGLWMTALSMRCLGSRLARRGFAVRYFRYPSWRGAFPEAAARLGAFVEGCGGERVHLLGHSLGGIVIAKMLEGGAPGNIGRVALLGCPVRGSSAAERAAGSRPGRFILGPVAREGIVSRRPAWPSGHAPLVVAGTLPLGFGLLFGVRRPHDGLIRVDETRVEGGDFLAVRASHVGLLLSRTVAEAVFRFYLAH